MRKHLMFLFALLCTLSFNSYAQMTDDQVIQYTKSAIASGKTESQVGKELLAKGVTIEQAQRIKAKYENSGDSGTSVTEQAIGHGSIERKSTETAYYAGDGVTSNLGEQVDENIFADQSETNKQNIFGHNIFNSRQLTFEPNENVATPENYKLGPGDEILVEIWGYNEDSINSVITPEGKIYISQIGPVHLSGLTIKEASDKIRRVLVAKYAGIGGEQPNSSVSVTLGRVRTIMVNIMGAVTVPGTYRLSSFSSVFHALYRAGGVTTTGSLRSIKVIRSGKEIAIVDVYGYLFHGKSDSDISLQEGDIIIVPPYVEIVDVAGSVKRPMRYELTEGETLSQLLEYAGGFASASYQEEISVVRETGSQKEINTVKNSDFASYIMKDGDKVTVGSSLETFANKIEVRGFVFRPGMYQLGDEISSVKQLVEIAGGPKEDAYLPRAIIIREKEDLSLETISINLGDLLKGSASDVSLKKNDILVVSSIHELEDRGTLTINGVVAEPGDFPFAEKTTIKDLIIKAGGLLPQASHSRVDVARIINNPNSNAPSDTLSITYSFALNDGLAIDGGEQFYLEPYDVVSVRRSPGFQPQKFVNISGKVVFPGSYVLVKEGERLSDLIARAGGFVSQAYPDGARLIRLLSDYEANINRAIVENSSRIANRDTISIEDLELGSQYSVAINLNQALQNPGSEYDVILKAGDQLVVPEYPNTVRIMGEVMRPNAVVYDPQKSLSEYIDAAGGYTYNGKRSKVYIVYMNGMASKSRTATAQIKPGCVIIVPSKQEHNKITVPELLAIASSAASLTTMTGTLFSIFK